MSEKSSRLGLYCVLLVVVVVVNIDLCVVCSSVCSTVSAPGGLEVNCSYRGLENVPDDLPTAGVVELALSWNSIKIIKNRTFTAFTDLLYLNLFQNPIHTVEPDAFIGLSSLRVLNLSHNRLSTWPDEPLRTLHSLKELNIYKLNLIESGPLPSGFRNITHLINFYLGWNGITNVTQDFFSNLHQVTELVIFKGLAIPPLQRNYKQGISASHPVTSYKLAKMKNKQSCIQGEPEKRIPKRYNNTSNICFKYG